MAKGGALQRSLLSKLAGRIKRRLRPRRGRRRLKDDLSVSDFIQRLNQRGCRYAVLRWFETLPAVAAGEDIDILVGDEDVDFVQSLLTTRGSGPGTPCDLYSVSGLTGSDYRSLPYYPPEMSRAILERAIRHPSGALVPCPEDHFRSLAFHALYHKGIPSGLPPESGRDPESSNPEHDYFNVLTGLAVQLGLAVNCDMQTLDRHLAAQGCRPPLDMLAKFGERNAWCKAIADAELASFPEVSGLTAFLIREEAASAELVDQIRAMLETDGFSVLLVERLDGAARRRAQVSIRGGTWTKGPYPSSGGPPAVLVMAHDVFPRTPERALARQHPLADNAHVFRSKLRIRSWYNGTREPSQQCNVIHASDNARHAAHYLQVCAPGRASEVLADARSELEKLETLPGRVLKPLSNYSRRAKVELVQRDDGTLRVRKTFRAGALRFLEREAAALAMLGRRDPFGVVPPILELTRTSVSVPYYRDTLSERRIGTPLRPPSLLPLSVVQRAFAAVADFYERGFVFLDFAPHNLVADEDLGLRLIDFEFVFSGQPHDAPFAKSPTIVGPSESWTLDVPVAKQGNWYERHWRPVTGLTLETLLGGDTEAQVRERRRYLVETRLRARWLRGAKRLNAARARVERLTSRMS